MPALKTRYSCVQRATNAIAYTPLLVQVTIDTIEATAKVLIVYLARMQVLADGRGGRPSRTHRPPPSHSA